MIKRSLLTSHPERTSPVSDSVRPTSIWVGVVVLCIALPQMALGATSVSVNSITFTFDRNYETGMFVDGMPWVVENSPGGGVTVNSITPTYSSGRHGYEVNPTTSELGRGEQGCNRPSGRRCDRSQLDERIANGIGGQLWVEPDSLPRNYPVNTSILKVESYTGVGQCFSGSGGAPARTCMETAAVLTILATEPAADSFRPPYPGTSKPVFSASSVDIAGLLPTLADVANQITIASAEGIFGDGGTWIDHGEGGQAGRMHPRLSVRTVGDVKDAQYGCQYGISLNAGMLRSMQSGTEAQKRNLVYRLMQVGIDTFYMTKNGKNFDNEGGCGTPGRKPVVLYTGYLLGSQPGAADFFAYNGGSDEDRNTFIGSGGEALWGVSSRPCVNSPKKCGGGGEMIPACDGLRDSGGCSRGTALGTLCPASCDRNNPQPQATLAQQRTTGSFSMTAYQDYTDVRVGSAAVARILGLEDEWNYPPFFKYIDRIATPPWNYHCKGHCFDYLHQMHVNYGCAECAVGTTPPHAPILLQ